MIFKQSGQTSTRPLSLERKYFCYFWLCMLIKNYDNVWEDNCTIPIPKYTAHQEQKQIGQWGNSISLSCLQQLKAGLLKYIISTAILAKSMQTGPLSPILPWQHFFLTVKWVCNVHLGKCSPLWCHKWPAFPSQPSADSPPHTERIWGKTKPQF